MTGSDSETLKEIARNTREIADWLALAYGPELKARLDPILNEGRKIMAYNATTGQAAVRSRRSQGVLTQPSRNGGMSGCWPRLWIRERMVAFTEGTIPIAWA